MSAAVAKFGPRDLCLVYGENDPRVSTIRLAERLHPTTRNRIGIISEFIDRNKQELERYGNIPCRTGYSGKRGQPAKEYLLNDGQIFIICMRSDSKYAEDARFETWQLIKAFHRGEIPHSDITIIADLFTPQAPTIQRGDGNVVHVTPAHESPALAPAQWEFDDAAWFRLPLEVRNMWWRDTNYGERPPSPEMVEVLDKVRRGVWRQDAGNEDDPADAQARDIWLHKEREPVQHLPGALLLDTWTDHKDGRAFPIKLRHDLKGHPLMLWLGCDAESSNCKIMVSNADGQSQVMVCRGADVPYAIIERNYLKLGRGDYTPIAIATLRHWLGDDDGDDSTG
jgi:hypothetical protein